MREKKQPNYMTNNFIRWFKADEKQPNSLDRADFLSDILFKKPYNELLTYQRNYIHILFRKGIATF